MVIVHVQVQMVKLSSVKSKSISAQFWVIFFTLTFEITGPIPSNIMVIADDWVDVFQAASVAVAVNTLVQSTKGISAIEKLPDQSTTPVANTVVQLSIFMVVLFQAHTGISHVPAIVIVVAEVVWLGVLITGVVGTRVSTVTVTAEDDLAHSFQATSVAEALRLFAHSTIGTQVIVKFQDQSTIPVARTVDQVQLKIFMVEFTSQLQESVTVVQLVNKSVAGIVGATGAVWSSVIEADWVSVFQAMSVYRTLIFFTPSQVVKTISTGVEMFATRDHVTVSTIQAQLILKVQAFVEVRLTVVPVWLVTTQEANTTVQTGLTVSFITETVFETGEVLPAASVAFALIE